MSTAPRSIQFVYPRDTKTVSLSGGGCALNCGHCNKHYIAQMDTLDSPVPEGTKSFLISGGLKKDGKSFILDKKEALLKIKKEGNFHFNSHVGFVDPAELDELASIVDYVSFDFVSDPEVIKRVYKLDRSVEEYIKLYKLLCTKIKTYPHVTIGLDAGKIHWEYEAINILHELGADRLVLNVLIPTPGTEFANVPKPDLSEVRKVFQHARKVFQDKLLIVGCMRPWGSYRAELDVMAIEEGVDRIVQPTVSARQLAEKSGMKISYLYECCALDTPVYVEKPLAQNSRAPLQGAPFAPLPPEVKTSCCSSGSSGSMIQFKKNDTAPNAVPNPEPLRVSLASAALLGLKDAKIRAKTKTIYLMNSGGCLYSCGFCSQGKDATSEEDKLSRVSWPEFPAQNILEGLEKNQGEYKRVCMQVVNTKDIFKTLPQTVAEIRKRTPNAKIALTIRTYKMEDIDAVFAAGADEVGLSIDAIDPEQFAKIKGGNFEFHKKFVLQVADKYLGKIATHLIVGLGESEKQMVELMEELHAHRVIIALFAFTPVKGSKMEAKEPPDTQSYHRIQVALHLIRNNISRKFVYDEDARIKEFGYSADELFGLLMGSNVFETSGCSDCNRPYYNERAGSKDLYNYPEALKEEEFRRVFDAMLTWQRQPESVTRLAPLTGLARDPASLIGA